MGRIVTHPQTGAQLNVGGRRRPNPHAPRLSLSNYLRANLPAPPPQADFTPKARAPLSKIYLNDQLGDCVAAGFAHMIGVWTANADPQPALFTDEQIKLAYHYLSDGQYPATDSGCDEEFALNFVAHEGFQPGTSDPHKILAWVAVDAGNVLEVRTALWLFEGLMSGVELPDGWINPPPAVSGFTWGMAGLPDPNNGHCMTHFSFDPFHVGVATWGMYGKLEWDALGYYMSPAQNGALYAAVSAESIVKASGKAPSGFDATGLLADAQAIGFVHGGS